jgi:D-glycero-D-manno-heptose 1,7-bisphosphate phosphatase
MISNRAVFFDRDGTLIKSSYSEGKLLAIRHISELEVVSNARKILMQLKIIGFKLVLVTNQSDVSRGFVTKFFVDNINDFLADHLELNSVKVCYDDEKSNPMRYKPGPEMLIEAANELNIDLGKSYMVGDRWRDVQAGKNAGCKTILIDNLHIENLNVIPDHKINNLDELLNIIS